jgi:hypothetical protein
MIYRLNFHDLGLYNSIRPLMAGLFTVTRSLEQKMWMSPTQGWASRLKAGTQRRYALFGDLK